MTARKRWRSAFGAESSNCRKRNPRKTTTPKVLLKNAAMWGFNRPTYLRILGRRALPMARQGDTRCKDYIPRFRMVDPVWACFCSAQQLA